jgi:Leucine-rich repeat (LRR) protein
MMMKYHTFTLLIYHHSRFHYHHNDKFIGSIPESLSNLSNLKDLRLSKNVLTNEIPISISRLVNLEKLHLDNNKLQGTVCFCF